MILKKSDDILYLLYKRIFVGGNVAKRYQTVTYRQHVMAQEMCVDVEKSTFQHSTNSINKYCGSSIFRRGTVRSKKKIK